MTRDELKAQIFRVAKGLRMPIHIPELPRAPMELPALKGKKILFVDDGLDVIAAFLVPLMLATDGAAQFIHQIRQTPGELTREILALDPDVVLIDQYLGRSHGHELVKLLLAAKPGLLCIGFSNAPSAKESFSDAGAKFVVKEASSPWSSLEDVAKLVEK
ncbi:response regulator [Candidatus Peregrinibacteria bacterium]|nr:response regulator [Candidatus Peregrinibacteria bacterium]